MVNVSGRVIFLVLSVLCVLSCKDQGEVVPKTLNGTISSDGQLFDLVTRVEPFATYTLFPHVDSVTSGTLNGSTAHQPLVRVSMNATAYSALRNDTLPDGARFRDGSIIFKQIRMNAQTNLYAVMYKDTDNDFSGNGWLWAEFYPDGTPFISLSLRGIHCTSCHSREQGPQHDFVRTFERQH